LARTGTLKLSTRIMNKISADLKIAGDGFEVIRAYYLS
jgi:hypothetical protein